MRKSQNFKIFLFRLIKTLDTNVDKTQNKMNFVQKKLSALLKTSGKHFLKEK